MSQQNDLTTKFQKLEELRDEFESFDLALTKELDLPNMSSDDLKSVLDIIPASGTRFRIVRELQKSGD